VPFTGTVPLADRKPTSHKSAVLCYKKVGRPWLKILIILILEGRDYETCSTREEKGIYTK